MIHPILPHATLTSTTYKPSLCTMLCRKLLAVLLIGVALASCVVRSQSKIYHPTKYQEAMACYEAKDYYEASKLFEEAIPLLRGKKDIILAHFYQACASFHQKAYQRSAHYFRHFYETYPRAPQAEEALYMQGYALYLASPDVTLDQTDTQEAVQVLHNYLALYPDGAHKSEAIQYLARLSDKLASKAFKNAQLYHQISQYQAAVIALTHFQQDFPHSLLNEEAAYLKTDAQYRLAKVCSLVEQEEKLRTTMTYCHNFLDQYPASRYRKTIEKIYEYSLKQINQLVKAEKP